MRGTAAEYVYFGEMDLDLDVGFDVDLGFERLADPSLRHQGTLEDAVVPRESRQKSKSRSGARTRSRPKLRSKPGADSNSVLRQEQYGAVTPGQRE